MLYDWRPGHSRFAGTVIQPFDTKTRTVTGERKQFYYGTSLGVCEGPQILKKDGYYYLLCAAGGTSYGHAATVARSKSLEGPWQESPYFPLLTSCDDEKNTLQKSGHAQAQFFYKTDGTKWFPLGVVQPADHLSDDYIEERRGRCAFTGAMVGICAQDMDIHRSYADFSYFTYKEMQGKTASF